MITCPKCGKTKQDSEFSLHWKTPSKQCKECIKKKNRDWYFKKQQKKDPKLASRILNHQHKLAKRGKTPENTQWCGYCKSFQPLDQFSKSGLKNHGWCRKCATKDGSIRAMKLKKKAIKLLGGKCSRCGYEGHWASYDFHHLNPQEKEMGWGGGGLRKQSWSKIIQELKKCVLLCGCCHAIVHCQ